MGQEELFNNIPHTIGGLESKFPSALHYRLAKKLSIEWYRDFRSDYEELLRKYSEIASSPLFAQRVDVLSSLETTITQIQSLGKLITLLKMTHEAEKEVIENGESIPTKKEGQVVPESAEVRLEGVNREIGLLGKIEHMKEYTARFIEMTVGHYIRAVNYAMANAETSDPSKVEKALERKEFRDDIIRFMHPNYEAAAEAQRGRLEFGVKYIDFLYDLMEAAKESPVFAPSNPIHRLPSREKVHQFLDNAVQVTLERLKIIYSPRQTL